MSARNDEGVNRRTLLRTAAWAAPVVAVAASAPLAAASRRSVAVTSSTLAQGWLLDVHLSYHDLPQGVTPESWSVAAMDPSYATLGFYNEISNTNVQFASVNYLERFTGIVTVVFSDGLSATSQPFTAQVV